MTFLERAFFPVRLAAMRISKLCHGCTEILIKMLLLVSCGEVAELTGLLSPSTGGQHRLSIRREEDSGAQRAIGFAAALTLVSSLPLCECKRAGSDVRYSSRSAPQKLINVARKTLRTLRCSVAFSVFLCVSIQYLRTGRRTFYVP